MDLSDLSRPAMRRRKAGEKLRVLRSRAEITMGQAAEALDCHPSKISRLELGQGQDPLPLREIQRLLDVYGLAVDDPERLALLDDVRATQVLPWWYEARGLLSSDEKRYYSLEPDTDEIRVWAPDMIPDLLQTAAYAAALEPAYRRQDKMAPRRQALLQARQALVVPGQREMNDLESRSIGSDSQLAPARRLWVILHESVLLQQVGDPDIRREQAAAVIQNAKEPGITIQVVRMSAGAVRGAGTPFTILRFPDKEVPDLAWVWTPATSISTSKRADLDRYRAVWALCGVVAEPPEATPDIIGDIIKGI